MVGSMTKRRLGRPPAPREQVRANRVVTLLTDEELSILRARANADDSSVSRCLYTIVARELESADKHHPKQEER